MVRSRCTGYRPILDAFRVFSEVPAGAYTEEAIAAHSQKAGDHDHVVGLPEPTGFPANGTIKMDSSKAVSPRCSDPLTPSQRALMYQPQFQPGCPGALCGLSGPSSRSCPHTSIFVMPDMEGICMGRSTPA